ncbi:MAG: ribose-phosphate diphosphokinase [Proteobacteria bacterium]|nr:ribose-phosphate diphosphokinase [Pseudomonadota bacterium]
MIGIVVHSLPESSAAAARLAKRLGVAWHEIDVHHFPDGELRVTARPAAATTIVFASLDAPNDKLMALLFAAEALRRGGAKRLVLVAPYLCYMRQDSAFHDGEAISQKVVGKLLATTVDRVITVDAHLHRTRTIAEVFPGIDADNLSAIPAIVDYLKRQGVTKDLIVVGPDAESEPWVRDLADRLGVDHAVGHKARHGDRSVDIAFADPKMFAGRSVLLVDDIVSSGGTLMTCASTLAALGAASIDAIMTHALFPAAMTQQFLEGGLRSVRSTDSVPHPSNAIELDAILGEALRAELAAAPAKGPER